ncbi:MAG TPA: DoxX family protein [Cyclobacteriaceae bacterium]|nr:DoxX family protein [Cyclobacteriaceae bacterium]
MKKSVFIIDRLAAIIAAIILLQTLYFKFTAHPDSVYIFSKMGVEPWGRILLGCLELTTAILLLYPKTALYGSVLGAGVISGAIVSHIFILGIVVQNDHGKLFGLALSVFICCLIILFIRRLDLLSLIKRAASLK